MEKTPQVYLPAAVRRLVAGICFALFVPASGMQLGVSRRNRLATIQKLAAARRRFVRRARRMKFG